MNLTIEQTKEVIVKNLAKIKATKNDKQFPLSMRLLRSFGKADPVTVKLVLARLELELE